MKLLDWISERLKPKPAEPDMVHSVFGPLAADDDCWQTLEPVPIKPLSASIFITITAGEDGPSEEHVEFFRSFAESYMAEFERAERLLRAEVVQWLERDVSGSLWDHLTLSSMSIPAVGDRRAA